ncbi:hypothetical protein [Aureimonas sp. ME7]|uniref:hypothetical protein n=1 Tax=Aureimonas sp. ME7 TaxID=2744252 RepID=UPI0015F3C23C|nr:hypothetical protein [Aureimonas sp. ME7]
MRFHVTSKEGPARRAKQLHKFLVAAGYESRLTRCQRLVAMMMGYRDWTDMHAYMGLADPSLGDAFVSERECETRRERHVAVLVEAGIEVGDAEAAVDAVGPTNYGEARERDDDDADADFVAEWGLRPTSRR